MNAAMTPADLVSAIDSAVADMAEPVKKARKPKAEDKPKSTNDAKSKEAYKPVLFKSANGAEYELAKDADPKAVKAMAGEVGKSLAAIGKKDADLLTHYLALGKFQSVAVKLFKSPKLYGQFLATELPATQELDAALRSNCKWLYEALNNSGAEGSDILNVLAVNRIEDYKSKNPTVIKRDYKAKATEAEKTKAAEELGKSVEELESEAKAQAQAEAEAARGALLAMVKDFAKGVLAKAEGDHTEALSDLQHVLMEALAGKRKDAVEMLESLTFDTEDEVDH